MFGNKKVIVENAPVAQTANTMEIEIFVAYNENGDFVADADSETAMEGLLEQMGGEIYRTVRLLINVPELEIPTLELTLTEDQTSESMTLSRGPTLPYPHGPRKTI